MFNCKNLTIFIINVVLSITNINAYAEDLQITTEKDIRVLMRKIVKDYISEHPEIIQEAIEKNKIVAADLKEKSQKIAINENRSNLYKSEHNLVYGNKSGKIILVEFFDYNCIYCRRSMYDIDKLIDKFPQLKVIYKDVPVLGYDSEQVSRLVIAAGMQLGEKEIVNLHRKIMALENRVGETDVTESIRNYNIDMEKLKLDANSKQVSDIIDANKYLFNKLSLRGTPQFVVRDQILSGAVGFSKLSEAIEN